MVTDTKKTEIKAEVQKTLARFGKTLDGLPVHAMKSVSLGSGIRAEGSDSLGSAAFRKGMFANAPKIEGDCIVAEKGAWTR